MNTAFNKYILAQQPFPVLGEQTVYDSFASVDLSIHNASAESFGLHTFEGLQSFIALRHTEAKAKVLYGGYLEPRALYQTSAHFSESEHPRNIHLGLDLWSPAGTPVYAPLDGVVHSFKYNDQPLDYGATIILEHQHPQWTFFSLYGHLSLSSLEGIKKGQSVIKGEKIAEFGPPAENGGWVPHLHLQLIFDLENMEGDYPGVCAADQLPHFRNNCPDPGVLLTSYSLD